jgi:hypothetical protein
LGVIDGVGQDVPPRWKPGQRVGVGIATLADGATFSPELVLAAGSGTAAITAIASRFLELHAFAKASGNSPTQRGRVIFFVTAEHPLGSMGSSEPQKKFHHALRPDPLSNLWFW